MEDLNFENKIKDKTKEEVLILPESLENRISNTLMNLPDRNKAGIIIRRYSILAASLLLLCILSIFAYRGNWIMKPGEPGHKVYPSNPNPEQVMLDEKNSKLLNYSFNISDINNIDKTLAEQSYAYSTEVNKKYAAVIIYKAGRAEITQYPVNNNGVVDLVLPEGSDFIVSLPANRTIAYTWNIKNEINNGIIFFEKRSWIAIPLPQSEKNKNGANYDRQNFYFRPLAYSNQKLVMRYEHQTQQRDDYFDITFNIKIGNITFDDQKQVEELINNYFSALQKKDYAAAWELTSSKSKESYSKEEAVKEHWRIETVRLVSKKAYMPSEKAILDDVPPNTPTIYFSVVLDIRPSKDSNWNNGLNDRFVGVARDNDGKWRIDSIATGP